MSDTLPKDEPCGSGRGASTAMRATIVLLFAAALLAGCAGNKKDDDIARLTGERDALREAIARDRAAIQNIPEPAAQPQQFEPSSVQSPSNIDFGPGTTTRRDAGDLVVEVAGDVLFDSGSISLKSSAKRTLDRIAGAIRSNYSGNTVRVEGYTDRDPLKKTKNKYKDNEELSAERALAVERYLVAKGIPASQIYSAAFGPAKPKGTKKASRRVEIVILGAN